MGRLTQEVFNESCCDGGECGVLKQSALTCGCDPGLHYFCSRHKFLGRVAELRDYFADLQRLDGLKTTSLEEVQDALTRLIREVE